MDALTHAVEAYISKDANPVTDAAAIRAIRLIARNLRQAVALGSNLKARENMAYASLLAGMAFNNANLGYVHAMAHQLGGLYDMPHGVANAVLLPHVARYNLIANPEKFADIAEFMGENTDGLSTMDAAELVNSCYCPPLRRHRYSAASARSGRQRSRFPVYGGNGAEGRQRLLQPAQRERERNCRDLPSGILITQGRNVTFITGCTSVLSLTLAGYSRA